VDKQLKPVTLRLGISDGTYTEVINAQELQEGMEVATGATGLSTPTRALPQQNQGNPFVPGRGGPGRGRG
jgi:hypothetical protein